LSYREFYNKIITYQYFWDFGRYDYLQLKDNFINFVLTMKPVLGLAELKFYLVFFITY